MMSKRLSVAWFQETPSIVEVRDASDGYPYLKIYNHEDSLRLMWWELERLYDLLRIEK